MSGKADSPKGKGSKYTELSDKRFGWFFQLCQWLSIRIMEPYFRLKFHMRIRGKENQPPSKQFSYIVACNHMSMLDPPLLSLVLDFQPVAYMAKMELFEKPLMRAYLWSVSSFAVNRHKLELSTVKTALKVLKTGTWALGIFPEGTRQKDGSIGAPKKGVAYFAKAGNVPILPVGIAMVDRKGGKKLEVRIGRLIPPEDDLDALGMKVQQAMADLIKQAAAGE